VVHSPILDNDLPPLKLIKTSLEHKILPPADSTGRHPALVLLHGRGSNEDDLLGLTPYLDPRFFFIAARAPLRFSFGGFTWYEMPEVGSPDPGQFRESYARLMEFLEDVKSHYPVDPGQMVLLGFSMGTVMAYAAAFTKPDAVAAVAANSGYVPEGLDLPFQWDRLKGKRFFVGHGVHDDVIGVKAARRAKELLSGTEAELTYREYPIGHTMSEESIDDVAHWLTAGLEGAG